MFIGCIGCVIKNSLFETLDLSQRGYFQVKNTGNWPERGSLTLLQIRIHVFTAYSGTLPSNQQKWRTTSARNLTIWATKSSLANSTPQTRQTSSFSSFSPKILNRGHLFTGLRKTHPSYPEISGQFPFFVNLQRKTHLAQLASNKCQL